MIRSNGCMVFPASWRKWPKSLHSQSSNWRVVFHIHAAVTCNFSTALGSMNGCMLGSSWEMRNKMAHEPTHPRKWKNPSVWHWNQLARGSIYKIWKASGTGWLVVARHRVTRLLVGNGLQYLWIYVYIRAPNGQYMSSWCIQKAPL